MDDEVLDELYAPSSESPAGSMADLMLGAWEVARDEHLCALCGNLIEDPLEECPTCAAEMEADGGV